MLERESLYRRVPDQTRLSSFQLTNAPNKVSRLAVPPTNL
jgi:hypothetical protein